jgi:hypothetical protein
LTTGTYNVAVGYQAGNAITTGAYNTAIGANAFTGASTYNYSTAIGYNAQITGNNQLVLGTSAETIIIPGSANSTGVNTGALQVNGGVGIKGNLYVNSSIYSTNSSFLGGTTPQALVSYYNQSQGVFIGWNTASGQGETDFVNCKGTGPGGFYFYNIATGGTVTNPIASISSTGAYSNLSDYRIKDNVVDISNATTVIKYLRPVKYEVNMCDNKIEYGFIAHEVQNVIPEAVKGNKDDIDCSGNPIYQSIDKVMIIPFLVKSIQDLLTIVENQQKQIDLLHNRY